MKLHESLAQNHSIRLQAEAETWQEAVKIGVDLLVAADVVEPRYYQAILDGVAQRAGSAGFNQKRHRGGCLKGTLSCHYLCYRSPWTTKRWPALMKQPV